MSKKIVSKCGARFQHHADKEIFLNRVIDEEKKPEKKTPQKRTYRKVSEKLGEDFPVNIEDENLDGVSV